MWVLAAMGLRFTPPQERGSVGSSGRFRWSALLPLALTPSWRHAPAKALAIFITGI
ncbi:MAG: hypothetical protein AAFO03_17565 [Bacteroidota bacterium]